MFNNILKRIAKFYRFGLIGLWGVRCLKWNSFGVYWHLRNQESMQEKEVSMVLLSIASLLGLRLIYGV